MVAMEANVHFPETSPKNIATVNTKKSITTKLSDYILSVSSIHRIFDNNSWDKEGMLMQ
jgi:hypothetical protein